MQVIDLTNDKRQGFTTVLDNQRVRILLYYLSDFTGVQGGDGWFINLILLSETEEIIALGERLATFERVAKNIPSSLVGAIVPVPVTIPFEDLVNKTPWDSTHKLIYLTASEFEDVQAIS